MPKKDELDVVLKELSSIGGIEGSAVVTRDGLLIDSVMLQDVDADTFAAMSATMMGAAETAISELKKGSVSIVLVEAKDAKIVTTGAGEQAILVVMAKPTINLGLVLVELKKAVNKIKKILG